MLYSSFINTLASSRKMRILENCLTRVKSKNAKVSLSWIINSFMSVRYQNLGEIIRSHA